MLYNKLKKTKEKEISNMTTINTLIDRMIALYGYEDPAVVTFCRACESGFASLEQLTAIVENHEKWRA